MLVKDGGEFHALGHKCPHYGAPLVKGEVTGSSGGAQGCPVPGRLGSLPADPTMSSSRPVEQWGWRGRLGGWGIQQVLEHGTLGEDTPAPAPA